MSPAWRGCPRRRCRGPCAGLPTVSAATRERVLDAAARLGYTASPSASRLAGGRTGTVAVVVPRITRWFFSHGRRGGRGGAARGRLRPAALQPGRPGAAPASACCTRANLHKRVDALMLVATPLQPSATSRRSPSLALPGVTVSSGTRVPGWPSVRIDDVAAARTATEHLLALGHRRIAHISGDPDDELAFTTHIDRRRGYRDGAAAPPASTPDPSLDVGRDVHHRRRQPGHRPAAGPRRAADRHLRRLRRDGDGRDRRAARGRPAGAGRTSASIGVDDHDLAGVVGLSTVAQPAAEQGRLAAETLLGPLGRATAGHRVARRRRDTP